jgi:hypothetical protein
MKKSLIFSLFFGGCFSVSAQTGVGTTSPKAALDVMGSAAAPSNSGSTSNGILRIQGSNSNNVIDLGNINSASSWLQSRNATNYATQTPLRLNPNGGNVSIGSTTTNLATLYVNGAISTSGAITSTAAGQLVNSVYLDETDLNISSNISLNTTTITNVLSYTYTPKSANSKIYIEFDANCVIGGYGGDRWDSYIYVGSNPIQSNTAYFDVNNGGGGRGNALFPISGYYSNNSTSSITIYIKANRTGGDDLMTVSPDCSLIIREISK